MTSRIHRLPLKVRLAAWYFVMMAVAMTALGWIAVAAMKHSIRTTVDEQLAARATEVKKLIEGAGGAKLVEAVLREHIGTSSQEELAQISDESGRYIVQSNWLAKRTLLPDDEAIKITAKHKLFFDAVVDREPFRGMRIEAVSAGRRYRIEVAQNMDDFEEALARFRRLLLGLIPAVLCAASLGGYWISRRALLPVDEITRATQEIGGRNLSARLVVPESGDELARLAETLNAMLERIDRALKQIGQFTADASHELRTPVALMRTRAELALRRPRGAEEHRQTIEELHAELVRTSVLVERLMLLARADSGAALARMEKLDSAALVAEVLEQTSVLAEAKLLKLQAELGNAEIVVDGDAQLLRQVVTILIDNAVKYTPAPGRITVRLVQEEGCARLTVADTGIGIEAGELERIFERFYRADKARSRETGGTGLGLAIGRFIAEAHGGTLTAESEAGKGSNFTLMLPLAK